MTKYILVGGYPYKAKDGGMAMCKEAVKGFAEPVIILICLFARLENDWRKVFDETKQFFSTNIKLKLNFELATLDSFLYQIGDSKLIYISGGDTTLLKEKLDQVPQWRKSLNSKTVIGSSAGADILSTYNYDLELFKCTDGLGLVPVKTLVHFKANAYKPVIGWDSAYQELLNYKEELPILTLREGEYKVISL